MQGVSLVLPVLDNKTVLIANEYREALKARAYNLIGGGIEDGETPAEAARRELEEESGYTAGSMEQIFETCSIVTGKTLYVFLAKDLVHGKSHPEETEDIEIEKLEIDGLKKFIKNRHKKDGMLVCALLYAKTYCKL